MFNARDFDADFALPEGRWTGELDSAEPDGVYRAQAPQDGRLRIRARSVVLLRDEADPGLTPPRRLP